MTPPPRTHRWWGVLFAAALLAVYVAAWRPLRAAFAEHVAYSALAAIETERAQRFRLDRASVPRTVIVRQDEAAPFVFTAPAGFLFLGPALLLIGLFPFKPYWLYYALVHLALGLLDLLAVGVGVGWSAWGFEGHRFLHQYVVTAVSLAAVPVALVREGGAGRRRANDGGLRA